MGSYVVLGVLVLLATWYLWRARPEDDASRGLPPSVLPRSDASAQRVLADSVMGRRDGDTPARQPAAAHASSSPVAEGDWRDAIQRLDREPSYRIKPGHADCQQLINAGIASLPALYEAVVRSAKSWVRLYPAMAVVAEGLGDAGRDAVAEQLSNAAQQHHGRMTSFLSYVASSMTPALVHSLCARVNDDNASAFGEAAAHHGAKALAVVAEHLGRTSPAHGPALQQMLKAMLASTSLAPKSVWKSALSHADPRVRAAAAQAGHDSAGAAAVRALVSDPDEAVRHAFVVGADEIPSSTLLRLTKDASPRVRAAAAWKLDSDDPSARSELQRLLADPHPAVALMAAVSLEDASTDERILAGLVSRDAVLRECAAQVAGVLPGEKFVPALHELLRTGSTAEIAAAVGSADDEPDPLTAVADVMRKSPAEAILRAGEIQLAFSECSAAVDLAAGLLSPQLPERVRRAGFYSIAPHRSAWSAKLEPFLRPEEPLLEDLIGELDTALISDEPLDRDLFLRIKERYPEGPLADLAEEALSKA